MRKNTIISLLISSTSLFITSCQVPGTDFFITSVTENGITYERRELKIDVNSSKKVVTSKNESVSISVDILSPKNINNLNFKWKATSGRLATNIGKTVTWVSTDDFIQNGEAVITVTTSGYSFPQDKSIVIKTN